MLQIMFQMSTVNVNWVKSKNDQMFLQVKISQNLNVNKLDPNYTGRPEMINSDEIILFLSKPMPN